MAVLDFDVIDFAFRLLPLPILLRIGLAERKGVIRWRFRVPLVANLIKEGSIAILINRKIVKRITHPLVHLHAQPITRLVL